MVHLEYIFLMPSVVHFHGTGNQTREIMLHPWGSNSQKRGPHMFDRTAPDDQNKLVTSKVEIWLSNSSCGGSLSQQQQQQQQHDSHDRSKQKRSTRQGTAGLLSVDLFFLDSTGPGLRPSKRSSDGPKASSWNWLKSYLLIFAPDAPLGCSAASEGGGGC